MFDAFTKVVAQADARGEFLNAGQIDALAGVVADSFKRMDAVNRITSSASKSSPTLAAISSINSLP